ncbi:DUF7534 family protein [Natronomonas sp. EA1]|uniref:DUF7534 family protein n=1 Tax=Natronomonas sp. EA1 TaxID=3421655 RepID=UPI003EBF347F
MTGHADFVTTLLGLWILAIVGAMAVTTGPDLALVASLVPLATVVAWWLSYRDGWAVFGKRLRSRNA